MGIKTLIQWAHHTFNAWIGCVHAGPECDFCYAEVNRFVVAQRARGRELWGRDAERHRTSPAYWRQPLAWDSAARAAGERRRVFCASLADVLERHHVPSTAAALDAWRADLWALVEATPGLDWMLLTKRPDGFRDLVPPRWHEPGGWPRNAWAGTTCGTQAGLPRVRTLLECAAAAPVRFVSAEPLLERVDFSPVLGPGHVNLLILGGESGARARPCDVAWLRSALSAAQATDVACFVKQIGSWPVIGGDDPRMCTCVGGCNGRASLGKGWGCALESGRLNIKHSHGGDPAEWPESLRVREFPPLPTA